MKYGPKSVVLMQVGAFFEMYGLKRSDCPEIAGSCVAAIATACGGLAISEKKSFFGPAGAQIVMAGFRDYTLDRHVQRVVEAGYTALIYEQTKTGAKITRSLSSVVSAGTFLCGDSPRISNHIMCIWVDVFSRASTGTAGAAGAKKRLVCGVATANIITGKSAIFEFEAAGDAVNCSTFDELERCVSVYSPSEVILIHPFERDVARTVAQYAGIQSAVVHYCAVSDRSNAAIEKCTQQVYVRHVLSAFFRPDTYDVCREFQEFPVATYAYCYLLHFMQEHNANLVRKIELPVFHGGSREMVLANHTLKQLNIIDDDGLECASGQLKSVASFMNRCCSAAGKRRFYAQLVRPVFDERWLAQEYDAVDRLMAQPPEMVDMMRKLLGQVADIEKIERQLVAGKLPPDNVFRLHRSLRAIEQIYTCFLECPELIAYFEPPASTLDRAPDRAPFDRQMAKILAEIERIFSIEKCVGLTTSCHECVFQPNISPELDELVLRKEASEGLVDSIRAAFNHLMSVCEKSGAGTEYVRVHDTDKSGSSLQMTKKRSAACKRYLAGLAADHKIVFRIPAGQVGVLASEIKLVSAGASNDEIEFPLLARTMREILSLRDQIQAKSAETYAAVLSELESALPDLRRMAEFAAIADTLQSKAFVARKYNYCRPTIISDSSSGSGSLDSCVQITGLRHCLIEHIQTTELYVANDIELSGAIEGKDPIGILLYGTNAVGKTSLIRALGIAVVLAQAGMFVPASGFRFKPYRAIFSRILGNDNLFKNLSTFAVEMSELRVILNHADERSLVLGDELCSGTETESALAIFMAGLAHLAARRASFIFATHFHEIDKFAEMAEIRGRVHAKHMAVHYDRELDALVYDRALRDGPGNRMYGLEVAKSLHLPAEFIESAYRVRNRYFPDTNGALDHRAATRYSAKKVRGMCELCKSELAEETHHLQEQHLATSDGWIGGIHKNHPANLMGLCATCHDAQHRLALDAGTAPKKVVRKVVRKKTTHSSGVILDGH